MDIFQHAVIKNAVKEARRAVNGDTTPNWEPLHQAIPLAQCDGFMWMGYKEHESGQIIELYKHGITRRYLNIDGQGNFYQYKYKSGDYIPTDKHQAIDAVYLHIGALGADKSTAYDPAYICERNKKLQTNGYKVA